MDDSEKPKKKRIAAATPDRPPDLPESFKEWIQRLGGRNPVLVIQKRLFSTDVSKQQNRLSIPLSALKTEFLKDHERQLLDLRWRNDHCRELKATILEGSGVERTIPLRKWQMKKKKGNRSASASSITYNLCAPWHEIVEVHGWEAGALVQVWAFRIGEDEELGLAVVNLDED